MSNLTLPTMTHANLDRILGNKNSVKLAYATTAERLHDGSIVVTQHGNWIAMLDGKTLCVSKAGWDSTTTATRLRKILADNVAGHSVRIRDYAMRHLVNGVEVGDFYSETFEL